MTFNQRLTARGAALVQRLTGHHGDGKDVTNPRELYTILSQAEAKRHQTCVSAPLLLTDATLQQKFNHEMKIRVKEFLEEKRPNAPPTHHQSSLELYDPADIPVLTFVRESSSLEDLTTLKRKETKISQNSAYAFERFPQISENRTKLNVKRKPNKEHERHVAFDIGDSADIVFPRVPKVLEKTLPIAKPFVSHPPLSPEPQENETARDRRLAGVPRELVGRTKQILMEETYRERLRARGLGLNRDRSLFPRERIRDLKAYDLYPGQYWELRAESVHRPEDLELDMIDRDFYRMKQKSMLKLKVVDGEWKTKGERVSVELPSSSPQRDGPRPVPRPYHPKPKASQSDTRGLEDESVGFCPVTMKVVEPVVVESEGTGHHETDSVLGFHNSTRTRRMKVSNRSDMAETEKEAVEEIQDAKLIPESVVSEAVTGQQETDLVLDPPSSSKTSGMKLPKKTDTPVPQKELDEQQVSYISEEKTKEIKSREPPPKYFPPTSVVHLTLNKEKPLVRLPRHIEENIQKQKQTVSESAPSENTNGIPENSTENRGPSDQESHSMNEVISEPEQKSSAPTRPADDSRNKKSLLTGFKKLEVFGETKVQSPETTQALKEVIPTRYLPQCHPPLYRMDMRNYPPRGDEAFFTLEKRHEPGNSGTADNNHMPLRVIDGELIFTKMQTTGEPKTSRTVKAEGAVGGHTSVRDTSVMSKS